MRKRPMKGARKVQDLALHHLGCRSAYEGVALVFGRIAVVGAEQGLLLMVLGRIAHHGRGIKR